MGNYDIGNRSSLIVHFQAVGGPVNKRPTGLNGHLSIRDFTPTSCQKGSYLYINNPIIEQFYTFYPKISSPWGGGHEIYNFWSPYPKDATYQIWLRLDQ